MMDCHSFSLFLISCRNSDIPFCLVPSFGVNFYYKTGLEENKTMSLSSRNHRYQCPRHFSSILAAFLNG